MRSGVYQRAKVDKKLVCFTKFNYMLGSTNLKHILFLDIETVPQVADYNQLNERGKVLWEKKSAFFRNNNQEAADVYQRAGIYAEFGKIVCISVGVLSGAEDAYQVKVKSFADVDEQKLLRDFIELLQSMEKKRPVILCAHNGKEFDFPYISRRLLVNALPLPSCLNNAGKKPWEIQHLDTLEMWKFGDYKHYTSLDLLTHIFNIPSPKEDIDGSMVAGVFYEEKNLPKIVKYCENDVVAIVQLLMRYVNKPLVKAEMIERTLTGL